MSTFTIDSDNNITALVGPADADRSTTFSTEKGLAKLIAEPGALILSPLKMLTPV